MSQSHYLLKGTFILTAAGITARFGGFFYKIFLSRTIGAENLGLFHLCMPLAVFCIAAAAGGMQTAVSYYTARYDAMNERCRSVRLLLAALLFSVTLALIFTTLFYVHSDRIAALFLRDVRCSMLLRLLALSFPFCAVHNCISGFFTGRKQIHVPALSQVTEQAVRIGTVITFYYSSAGHSRLSGIALIAVGQIAGEAAAAVFCLCIFFSYSHFGHRLLHSDIQPLPFLSKAVKCGTKTSVYRIPAYAVLSELPSVLSVSIPLSVSRMLLGILQAIEAALLPLQLQLFGLTRQAALTIYGTLSGMTLPLLLFPTAFTSAAGTLLIPQISEARSQNKEHRIRKAADISVTCSFLVGFFFFTVFFLCGDELGAILFKNRTAGSFLRQLSVICPLLYVNTITIPLLHGAGRTTAASLQSTSGFLIRLAAVIILVPRSGIDGYLLGVAFSQLFVCLCSLFTLSRCSEFCFRPAEMFLKPAFIFLASVSLAALLHLHLSSVRIAGLCISLLCTVSGILIFLFLTVLFYRQAISGQISSSVPDKN